MAQTKTLIDVVDYCRASTLLSYFFFVGSYATDQQMNAFAFVDAIVLRWDF
jgi:hypothetical protein